MPREKLPTNGEPLFIPGQDTGQGSEQTSQSPSPLPGASNPRLVPYSSVYQSYLDTAGQALDQSAIPADLKDFVRRYFSIWSHNSSDDGSLFEPRLKQTAIKKAALRLAAGHT